MFQYGETYKIELSDGTAWQLAGTEEVKPWLLKLASILKLEKSGLNILEKILFTRISSDKEKAHLIEEGWRLHDIEGFRFWRHPQRSEYIFDIGQPEEAYIEFFKMRHALYPLYLGNQKAGGLPFHAALVRYQDKGFLLAAPGGTGKSTACRRLPAPWRAISEDEALVTRVNGKGYFVHPFPTWSDHILRRPISDKYSIGYNLPLSAIFFLERSEEDKIVPLGKGYAALNIYNSALQILCKFFFFMDGDQKIKFQKNLFENACDLSKTIPSFKLLITLKGKFWKEMKKALSQI